MVMKSSTRGTVLVIENSRNSGPRRLLPWLSETGLSAQIEQATDLTSCDVGRYNAMIILGGAPLPDQDADYPWLPREREVISDALEKHIPILGICLGAQLLAFVAGGTVRRRVLPPEHGMCCITNNHETANADALFSRMPDSYPMTENHVDAITSLPDDAVHLASSQRCKNQAFRIGSSAWGVQFHPEVSADNIVSWDSDTQRSIIHDGYDWQGVVRSALAQNSENTKAAHTLITSFASRCV
jgi:GMP synthase-like glutamine amidotransferase